VAVIYRLIFHCMFLNDACTPGLLHDMATRWIPEGTLGLEGTSCGPM